MRRIDKERAARLTIRAAMGAQPGPRSTDRRDDERIAADFCAHAPGGLERVYVAYGKALFSVARHVLGNDLDAEDCVHDALLRLWQRADIYRPERGSLRSYLLVSVRNDAISRKRNAARHARIEEQVARSDDAAYEFDPGDAVEHGRLRDALAALPAEQRQALALTYFAQLTHAEAAVRLAVPLGTVKGRLRLALAKLSAALRER